MNKITESIMQTMFWLIVGYLFYKWGGIDAALGWVAFLLFVNVAAMNKKKNK